LREGWNDLVAEQLQRAFLFGMAQTHAGMMDELVHAQGLVELQLGDDLIGRAEHQVPVQRHGVVFRAVAQLVQRDRRRKAVGHAAEVLEQVLEPRLQALDRADRHHRVTAGAGDGGVTHHRHDRARRAGVGGHRLKAAFAAKARTLDAAESRDGRDRAIGIDPDDAGPHRAGHAQLLPAVAGEDAAGKAVSAVVGDGDGLGLGPESPHGQHRAEEFGVEDRHAGAGAMADRGGIEGAAGRGYVADLGPEIARMAPVLGQILTDRLVALAGSGEAIEAYGKAAMGGTEAEMEHVSALIQTLRFGNFYREAVGARTHLGFTTARAAPGGRSHHRIGDCYADLAAMGHDVDNPAGV
jgi:hypothetical protein